MECVHLWLTRVQHFSAFTTLVAVLSLILVCLCSSELEGLLLCVASLLHLVEEGTTDMLQRVCGMLITQANKDNAPHRLRM